MIAFWILAPVMVVAALGILVVRKAVHAALLLAVVMISLAVLYLTLQAPFLFAVQIIVYTGAILMLFLFVLMLVGVDAADSLVETIRGQRPLAVLAGVGAVVLMLMLSWQLSLLLALLVPIEVLWLRWMRRKVEREVRNLRERSADVSSFLVETLPAMKFIQAAGQQGREAGR